jgi:CheY-like chemotaxis protein
MMAAKRSVLVVDDDPISRELVGVLLEAEGYAVQLVESGEEAIEYLKQNAQVDAVLTDMQMPGLSGAELVAELRKVAKSGVRLIAMSASQPDPKKLKGFDGFLLKPFEAEDFTKALEAAPKANSASSPDATSEDAVLNAAVFEKFAASMKRPQLMELYAACIEDSRCRIEVMRTSDDAVFRKEAHAIKGACSMLGAVRLAKMAAAMESAGGCDSVDATLDEFLRECDALEGMLISSQILK